MKNSIKGWKEIFSFTFIQGIKAKSIKISLIIMCVIAFAAVPAISLIKGDEKEKKTTSVKQVKVVDSTGLNIMQSIDELKAESLYDKGSKKLYADVEYSKADIDTAKLEKDSELKDIYTFDKDAEYIYMQITYVENSFDIEMIYSTKTDVKDSDVEAYTDFVEKHFNKILMKQFGASASDMKIINSKNTIAYCDVKDIVNKDDTSVKQDEQADNAKDEENKKDNKDSKYNIIYAILMVSLFALAFGGERIAMSIITEKSSKVMEYLMTSVKPMAIVVGKILANLLILLIQLGTMLLSFGLSLIVNGAVMGGGIPDYIKNIFVKNNFAGTNLFTVVIAVIILVEGFILFGLIAALAGASVSKMEEMSEGVKMYTVILIISAYLALFLLLQGGYDGASTFKYVLMILPFTSIFLTPGMMLTGYASMAGGLAGVIASAALIVFLLKFVADVYESMIYYSGTPLKLKDIINISKQNRKNKSGEAK